MSEMVEAYQKWLGIPPEDQPPDHYRLLGLELFETDRPTIDAAAKRLMGMLQKQLAGPDQASVRKLLDEISEARRCLLLSDRKTAYDQLLRASLEAKPPRRASSEPADVEEPVGIEKSRMPTPVDARAIPEVEVRPTN